MASQKNIFSFNATKWTLLFVANDFISISVRYKFHTEPPDDDVYAFMLFNWRNPNIWTQFLLWLLELTACDEAKITHIFCWYRNVFSSEYIFFLNDCKRDCVSVWVFFLLAFISICFEWFKLDENWVYSFNSHLQVLNELN